MTFLDKIVTVCCCAFTIIYAPELLLQRLPYRLLRTTRGNPHLNTSQLPFGLHFTFPLILIHDQSSTPVPHLHTHRPVAKSWFALLSFLSVLPVFTFLLSDLGLFARYSDRLLPAPTWIVFIGLWLLASCPDLLPGVLLCLCLASTVLPYVTPGSAPSHRAGLEPGIPAREAGALPRRLKATAPSVSR